MCKHKIHQNCQQNEEICLELSAVRALLVRPCPLALARGVHCSPILHYLDKAFKMLSA